MRSTICLTIMFIFMYVVSGRAEWIPLSPGASVDEPIDVQVKHSDLTETLFRVRIPGVSVESKSVEDQNYSILRISGSGVIAQPGLPLIPVIRKRIAIPVSTEYSLKLNVLSETKLHHFNIWPAQPPFDRDDPVRPSFMINCQRYRTDRFFPDQATRVVSEEWIRELRTVTVEIVPIQYNPVSGDVLIITDMEISIETPGGQSFGIQDVFPSFLRIYENCVLNASALNLRERQDPEPMLIIADDPLIGSLSPYVEWKTRAGISVTVVPTSVSGSSAESVRAFIENAYSTWTLKPVYILLVGDYQQIEPVQDSPYSTPSDYLFTTLDGTDWVPDVLISRLPAQNVGQLTPQLDKIIHYESAPMSDPWLDHITGISSSLSGSMGINDDQRLDAIADRWRAHNTNVHTDRLYISNGQGTTQNIRNAINEGRFWTAYLGHGSGTSWSSPYFSINDVDALTNEYLTPFVMDVSCLNGGFGGSSDCFAERWMRGGSSGQLHGAVGIYSSYTSTSWDPSAILGQGVCFSVTGDAEGTMLGGARTMGEMTLGGMLFLEQELGLNDDTEEVFHQYFLFGDCSVLFRSDELIGLQVSHLPTIPLAAEFSFEVRVWSEWGPVEGATVNAYQTGEFHTVGYTDENGMAVLPITPNSIGEMIVTVTGTNLDPYEAIVPIASTGCGIIAIQRSIYTCDDLIEAAVFDTDGNRDPNHVETISIDIASTSEPIPETLTLTETGSDTSEFRGDLRTSSLQSGSGYLLVSHGDTITLHYHDDDCDGTVVDVTKTAGSDCLGPVFSGLTVENISTYSATITWTTDEPSDSVVIWGDAIPPAQEIQSTNRVRYHSVILTGLEPCTRYYFAIRSSDRLGNTTYDNNDGSWHPFDTWELTEFFSDDMENGVNEWAATGLWHLVPPESACNEHHSGQSSWYYGQESTCNTNTGSTTIGNLRSRVIDLRETSQATLQVWYWHQGEDYQGFDQTSIQLEIQGQTPITVGMIYGDSQGWQVFEYDLEDYVGNFISIIFNYHSGDSMYNTFRGSFIDDVSIVASQPCSSLPTPSPCIHDGDVNANGVVTATDAQVAFGITLGIHQPTIEEECSADCNGNGVVTAADAQMIFMKALGLGACQAD